MQINQDLLRLKWKNGNRWLYEKGNSEISFSLPLLGEQIHKSETKYFRNVIAAENEIFIECDVDPMGYLKKFEICQINQQRRIKVPVLITQDSNMWGSISNLTGLDQKQYINNLLSAKITVAMFGFLPGFVYMNGLPHHLQCPRKARPSLLEKANTLAVGGKYIGFYALRSPSGWYPIGHCPIPLFNHHSNMISPFRIQDEIEFVLIEQSEYQSIQRSEINLEDYNG